MEVAIGPAVSWTTLSVPVIPAALPLIFPDIAEPAIAMLVLEQALIVPEDVTLQTGT
jgi:hypothetical protein